MMPSEENSTKVIFLYYQALIPSSECAKTNVQNLFHLVKHKGISVESMLIHNLEKHESLTAWAQQ